MFYFKFHIGDYRRDTAHLTLIEHAVYMNLMFAYYTSESPLPKDDRQLMRLAGARTEEEKQAVLDIVPEFFIETETQWVHSRIDFELKQYQSKADANRENGKKGGRPKKNPPSKLQNNPVGFDLVANKTQVDSDSEPNTKPSETLTHEPINPLTHEPIIDIDSDKPKRFNFKSNLLGSGGDVDLVDGFMAVRKTKKATNSEQAFNSFMSKVNNSGMTLNQVLQICIERDWKSFDVSWLKNQNTQTQNNRPPDIGNFMKGMGTDFLDVTPNQDYLEHKQ